MTSNELKIWATDGSGGAIPLETADQMATELQLEDTLVNYPDMLMPGLTMVGRQTRTEGGPLDLLGVDRDGRLALFELKRGSLNRDAVAKIVDYGSSLESMDIPALAQHIANHSGSSSRGIDKIDDFAEWYDQRWTGQELGELLPIRLFLVGLGVDDTTLRMVRYLADKNVDISLLTFLGFTHDDKTLLARQVQVEASDPLPAPIRPRPDWRERRKQLDAHIQEHTEQWPEAQELWDAVLEMFQENFPGAEGVVGRGASDWSKRRLRIRPPGRGGDIAAIQLGPDNAYSALVSAIFFPNVVTLCLDEFTQLRREMPFKTWPPNDQGSAEGVTQIQFQLDSLSEWETHKEKLAAATRSVYDALIANEDE